VRSRVGKVLGNLTAWKSRYDRKRKNAIAEQKYRHQMQKAAALHNEGGDSVETLPGFSAPAVFESIKFNTTAGIPTFALPAVVPPPAEMPTSLYPATVTETPGLGAVPMNDMPGNMGLGALANRLGFNGFTPSIGLPGMAPMPTFQDLPDLPGMQAVAGLVGMLPADPQFAPMSNEEADRLLASVADATSVKPQQVRHLKNMPLPPAVKVEASDPDLPPAVHVTADDSLAEPPQKKQRTG